jgi:hypothetical protein
MPADLQQTLQAADIDAPAGALKVRGLLGLYAQRKVEGGLPYGGQAYGSASWRQRGKYKRRMLRALEPIQPDLFSSYDPSIRSVPEATSPRAYTDAGAPRREASGPDPQGVPRPLQQGGEAPPWAGALRAPMGNDQGFVSSVPPGTRKRKELRAAQGDAQVPVRHGQVPALSFPSKPPGPRLGTPPGMGSSVSCTGAADPDGAKSGLRPVPSHVHLQQPPQQQQQQAQEARLGRVSVPPAAAAAGYRRESRIEGGASYSVSSSLSSKNQKQFLSLPQASRILVPMLREGKPQRASDFGYIRQRRLLKLRAAGADRVLQQIV